MGQTLFITALVCVLEFNAWGKEYKPGDVLDPEDVALWPAGTLETRLQHGFVKYATIPNTDEGEDPEDPGDGILSHPELLEGMTKADIVKSITEVLGEDAAKGLDPVKLNKADLLVAAKTLIAEHNAS